MKLMQQTQSNLEITPDLPCKLLPVLDGKGRGVDCDLSKRNGALHMLRCVFLTAKCSQD